MRLKEDLKDFKQRPLFPPRQVHTVKYRLSDKEKQLYNEVTRYVQQHFNRALQKKKRNVAFALMILQRRLASSTRAIRKSLERRKARLEELLKQGRIIQEEGTWDEEELEDLSERERWEREELLEKLTDAETLEELEREIEKLSELVSLAREVERQGEETKLVRLQEVVQDQKLILVLRIYCQVMAHEPEARSPSNAAGLGVASGLSVQSARATRSAL